MLSSQEHLEFGIGHHRLYSSQPFPGVLLQVPHTGVKGGTPPDLYGVEATLVQGGTQGEKVVGRDPGGQFTLLPVPGGQVGNLNPSASYRLFKQRPYTLSQLV